MRRKREICLKIHLSPPLSLSFDSLERYSTFFSYYTTIRNLAAGPTKKREVRQPGGFTGL